jgi:hypothetical protein
MMARNPVTGILRYTVPAEMLRRVLTWVKAWVKAWVKSKDRVRVRARVVILDWTIAYGYSRTPCLAPGTGWGSPNPVAVPSPAGSSSWP